MTTVTAKTFKSGNSVAVRLPRDIAYPEGLELTATRTGDVVVLSPKKRRTPAETIAALRALPKPDYIQERPPFEMPNRPGLYD